MHAPIETATAWRRRWLQEPRPAERDALVARYLAGWAEVNIAKIIAATAPDYRFDDPLVGTFAGWTLGDYLAELRRRFAATGPVTRADLAFHISGPLNFPPRQALRSPTYSTAGGAEYQFHREAPRLGLTGITIITVGEHGVTGERVAYDLNPALALLRRG